MLVTLVSAGASRGVTATSVALAARWPRPVVLVEADPTGGSGILAGFFRGQEDPAGLIDLVIAQRSDLLAEVLPRLLLPIEGTHASVLVGTRSHEQASGLAQLWAPLLEALRGLEPTGVDVLVDGGRLGLHGWPRPLVVGSDVTLLLLECDLPALAAARSWSEALSREDTPAHATRLLLVGEGRPYSAREVSRTLGVPVLGSIAWDPERAAVYSHGRTPPTPAWWRRIARGKHATTKALASSAYIRSIDATAGALRALHLVDPPSRLRMVLSRAGAFVERSQ